MVYASAFRTGLAITALACASWAQAAPLNVGYDNFTYSGTVTRYGSLADAQSQTNATGGPYTIGTAVNDSRSTRPNARDGNLSVTSSAPAAYGSDLAYLSTAWYFTTFPANGDGWGNPNNTNDGFIQYYDETGTPTITGGWQPGYTQFQLTVTGGSGDTFNAGRFWPAPNSGAASISSGEFVDFNLNLNAQFASPAVLNSTTSWYETSAMPASMTGTLTGIFLNNGTDANQHGYYRFSYTLTGPGSWAEDNSATWDDDSDGGAPPASLWAAPAVVAQPTTVAPVPSLGQGALLGLSLALGLMAAMRQGSRGRSGRSH